MADWPQSRPFNKTHISVSSLQGTLNGGVSSIGSAAWPIANRAIYAPFRLSFPFSVSAMWVIVGTAISGSVDLGIYSADGTRLVSSGIGTPTSINSIYSVTFTDIVLAPGQYFMAMSNGIVGQFQRISLTGVSHQRATGCFQQATAHPLPSTAAFAAVTTAYLPCVGITSKSTI